MTGAELILSKSAIDLWGRCNRAWMYAYAYRVPGAPNLDMAIGTAVHAGAEAHWKGEDPDSATRKALARELALIPALASGEATGALVDALAMTRLYLDKIVPTFTPTLVEKDFLIRVDGQLVSGRIDAADGDVHDTKTTGTPSKVDPKAHRLGMTLYRWGYRALTGNLPGRLLLDVVAKNGRWKIAEVEPDEQGTAEVVGMVARGVNAGDFAPTGASRGACHSCAYVSICKEAIV